MGTKKKIYPLPKTTKEKRAEAGGGGMHQMGPARKTPKKLSNKERALMALRKKKRKII